MKNSKKNLLILLFFAFSLAFGQNRIIGGNDTTIDQNPWQVSMRATNNHHIVGARNNHICGGSILTSEWILTAAHCVTNTINGNVIGVNEITISAGITQRNDLTTGQYRNVAQIVRHPNYNSITFENDLALIRLTAPLNFNSDVQPIQLTDEAFDSSPSNTARVTGWGLTTDNGFPSNNLQTLDMPIISSSSANSQNTGSVQVTYNMIALRLANAGVAPGDSGGPATVLKSGQRFLIGCSSWGEAPKDNKPTIYTRLYNYRNWIDNFVAFPYISGNSLLCNTNTSYTLHNGTGNITWSSSSNIQVVSGSNSQVTVKASSSTSSGNGWIRATSSHGYTITERLNVNQNAGQSPMTVPIYNVNSNYIDITANGGSGETPYSWYINNSFYTNTTGRTLTKYYTESSIRVEVRNDNVCNTGTHSAYYTGQIPGRYYFRVSPNPVKDYLTISEISPLEERKLGLSNQKTFEYILSDFQSNIFLQGKGEIGTSGFDLDLNGLKKGLYILEIISERERETHKIIKE